MAVGMELAVKLVMIGDSNVGKSQLSLRYCKKKYMSDSQSTVGIEFATRALAINEYTVKAQIWDTAGVNSVLLSAGLTFAPSGQERFESMTKAYFRNAAGALLVYDIGNRQSFENMKNRWLVQLKEFGHEDMFVIVVGNKSDIDPSKRMVSIAEAAEFAESTGLDFVETSARTGEHVEIAFRRVIVSVSRLLPGIKDHIRNQKLPRGWIYVSDKKKYVNMWTGASTDIKPEIPAETGLLVSTILKEQGLVFRDSSSSASIVNMQSLSNSANNSTESDLDRLPQGNDVMYKNKKQGNCCIIS